MTEEIINLQALLVKSYLLNALLINRKAFPIGYHGAQVLRPASRYSARLNAVRRDCLLWVISGGSAVSVALPLDLGMQPYFCAAANDGAPQKCKFNACRKAHQIIVIRAAS
jgi:hypothetical protein